MCVTCRIHYILICYHMRKCTHGRRAVKIISLEAVFDRDGMPFSVGGHIIFHWICTLFCCASFGCGYIDSFGYSNWLEFIQTPWSGYSIKTLLPGIGIAIIKVDDWKTGKKARPLLTETGHCSIFSTEPCCAENGNFSSNDSVCGDRLGSERLM